MAITTFCMAGAGPVPRLDANHLGGELFTGKYRRRDVLYPNKNPDIAAFAAGKAALRFALSNTPGQIICVLHSMGARIGAGLLRDVQEDAIFQAVVNPNRVIFIFTGNPERKYNGACNIPGSLIFAAYGGNGAPEDTPYQVFDVARQYEFFADHPNDRSNKLALSNVGRGFGLHLDYSGVRMGDPDHTRIKEGNITYVTAPTFPMPEAKKLFWGLKREVREDAKIRQQVERAYTRPRKVPTPTKSRQSDRVAFSAASEAMVSAPAIPAWVPPFAA